MPQRLAGVLVEGDDGRSLADVDEDALAIDERRTGGAEEEVGGLELLEGIDLPDLAAGVGVEAGQHAGDTVGIDLAIDDGGSAARAVAEQALEGRPFVGFLPHGLAGHGVERGEFLLILVLDLGVQVNLALGDDGRTMPFADGLRPENLGLLPRRDLFLGAAVAARSQPLRPVGGERETLQHEQQPQRIHSLHGAPLG